MKKIILFLTAVVLSIGTLASVQPAQAQGFSAKAEALSYPINLLGNCQNQQDCKAFCDKPENMMACVDYGQANGMISKEEAGLAKKVIPKIMAGQTPGGCKDKNECENYCQSDNSRLVECVAFAEEVGALPVDELAQAKKVAKVLQEGTQTPGSCSNKKTCEQYCADTAHIEECLVFAEKAQILPAEEIVEARKVMKFLQSGETPGKCATKATCKDYCDKEENFEECISFAQEAGFVSEQEADMARKTGGKGPGGCRSEKDCADYCNLDEHAKECADFAIGKSLVSDEEADKIKHGAAQLREGLAQIPQDARAEVDQCLAALLGQENFAKLQAGEDIFLTKKQGDGIGPCIESVMANYAKKMAEQAAAGAGAAAAGAGGAAGSGGGPAQGQNAPPADIPVGAAPPAGYKPDAAMCAQFKTAPSCSVVPASVRGLCEQCR
ncbi:MAG: hypothetical protein PHU56_03740 [Candidatus Pacebacteria bacterium]|nr:hypothetical protein [Candidatus Paceibacterota bacterium]